MRVINSTAASLPLLRHSSRGIAAARFAQLADVDFHMDLAVSDVMSDLGDGFDRQEGARKCSCYTFVQEVPGGFTCPAERRWEVPKIVQEAFAKAADKGDLAPVPKHGGGQEVRLSGSARARFGEVFRSTDEVRLAFLPQRTDFATGRARKANELPELHDRLVEIAWAAVRE